MSERILPLEGPAAPHRVVPGKKPGRQKKRKENEDDEKRKNKKKQPEGDDGHLVDRRA